MSCYLYQLVCIPPSGNYLVRNHIIAGNYILVVRAHTPYIFCAVQYFPGLRPNPHTARYSSINNGLLSSHPWRFMGCTTYSQEGSYSTTRRRYVRLPSDVCNLNWHFIFSLWLTGQHDPASCTRGMSQFGIISYARVPGLVPKPSQHLSLAVRNLCEIHILQAANTVETWDWG